MTFGDLTVVVGPQATGKSLLLQSLKLGLDAPGIRNFVAGQAVPWPKRGHWEEFVEFYYGEGFTGLWTDATTVTVDDKELSGTTLGKRASGNPRVLYIPAQRSLILTGGFPTPFREFGVDVPYAVREFSHRLHQELLASGGRREIFPIRGKLSACLKKAVDGAIFAGTSVALESTGRNRYELVLTLPDGSMLPTIAWTAGQREFVPLLTSLYPALPGGAVTKSSDIEWIILEEPEMGLHPKAILAVMYMVFELIHRGYRVVMSTHHPVVLDAVWALDALATAPRAEGVRSLLRGLGIRSDATSREIAASALGANVRVFSMEVETGGGSRAHDISGLDPASPDDAESGWGGLTAFSSQLADAVAGAMAHRGR